jgi:predicted acyl esterase
MGKPGPAIGFLQECLRWWDHWLKGIDTGVMAEPTLRAWMTESHAPSASYEEWPGRWVAEPAWPPRVERRGFALNARGLDPEPADETELAILGTLAAGQDAGVWCPYGAPGDFPPDQRAEDGRSLIFTSAPLAEPLEILGFPEVTLALAADRPIALVAVRLCDVAPDGASTLVTRGLLNLTHRHSHEQPAPLVPGERYGVTVRLGAIGWAVPAGHRLRVAVSPTYWPWAWPSPEPVTLRLLTGVASRLDLPVRSPRPEDAALAPFAEPEAAPPLETAVLRGGSSSLTVTTDVVQGKHRWLSHSDAGHRRFVASGTELEQAGSDAYEIVEGNPLSAVVRCERLIGLRQGDWAVRVEASAQLSADREAFHVSNQLDAYEGDVRVLTKNWACAIPRDHV